MARALVAQARGAEFDSQLLAAFRFPVFVFSYFPHNYHYL